MTQTATNIHIIEFPRTSESVVEGAIGKWLKQPGDRIERYEPLVEMITDKINENLPSPVSGELVRILAQEGETVPVGAPIAEVKTDAPAPPAAALPLETAGGTDQPIPDIGSTATAVAPSAVDPSAAPSVATPATSAAGVPATPPAAAPRSTVAVNDATATANVPSAERIGYLTTDATIVGPTGGGAGDNGQPSPAAVNPAPRLSPAVRRLAREHNLDPSQIAGTGMGGRTTRDDVLRYLESGASAAPAPSPTAPSPTADEETITPSPVRRMIADAMARSVAQIPHAWSMVEVDVTNLVAARSAMRSDFQQREGVDLTYLPFVIGVLAQALKENPSFNAGWQDGQIILKRRLNIGLAVASPAGLVVPVIPNADRLSLSGLAHAVADLTQRARQNRLTRQDVAGGTFTLNNTGALGSTVSQPIINHPQAAIMTTEAIQKRPVVRNDAIAIRSMMNLCLSFDHRINDGAEAAAFIQAVKGRLEALGPERASL